MSSRHLVCFVFCLVASQMALANVQNLECKIKTTLNQSAHPAQTLSVAMDEDSTKTVINDVQVQASRPDIAKTLGLAQLLKWNNQQVSISADLKNLWIKDVASYDCE